MRQIIILLATIAATAAAVDYCPTSALNGQVFHSVTSAGASDAATGCTVGGGASGSILTLDLTQIPPAPGAASEVSFTSGTVSGVSLIRVQLPSGGDAANGIPVNVAITGTQFQAGSGIQVFGSFPPQSSLTISGNSIEIAVAVRPAWFIDTFTAIALYDATINDNALVTISDNTITGSGDLSTMNAAVGISWRGGVTYGSGAVAQVVRNSISLTCQSTLNPTTDQQACVVGLHMMANQFFTGFASSLLVDGNSFSITGGLVAAMPPISSIGGVIGTLVSFSDNVCQATTTGAVGTDAVTFGYLSLGSDAQYAIKNNSLTLTGTTACGVGFGPKIPVDAMWDGGQDPPTGLADTAVVSFSSNTIQTTGCDGQIHIGRDHQLVSSSQFLMNSNSLSRVDQLGGSAAVMMLYSLTLQDSAVLSVNGNTWNAPSASSDALLFGYAFSPSVGITGPLGSVRACGNVLYGSSLSTEALVRSRCPDAMSTIITASECIVDVTEDTVQNTLAPTTNAQTTVERTSTDASQTTIDQPTSTVVTGPATTAGGPSATTTIEQSATDVSVESTTTPEFVNNTGPSTQPSSAATTCSQMGLLLLIAYIAAQVQ
eukprot:GILI01002276.1.p1 GENE.GILI01002276.1~~GILI01002276.1.p1  ORF type:complete len:601 (+),score=164.23 GILI01002276.1:35-1837(+)